LLSASFDFQIRPVDKTRSGCIYIVLSEIFGRLSS
jgi:hypothetical protein